MILYYVKARAGLRDRQAEERLDVERPNRAHGSHTDHENELFHSPALKPTARGSDPRSRIPLWFFGLSGGNRLVEISGTLQKTQNVYLNGTGRDEEPGRPPR